MSEVRRYEVPRLLTPVGYRQALEMIICAALCAAFIVLGPLPVKVAFAYVLAIGVMVRCLDGGYVEVGARGIRIRSYLRMDLAYSDVSSVDPYKPRLRGRFGKLMNGLRALQPRSRVRISPAVSVKLRRTKWTVIPIPLPVPLPRRTVYLFLSPDDVESFTGEVTRRLASEC
jgi:hypothetical protein